MTREQFLEVTDRWYKFVSRDHHKDRDCRFHIDEVWEYGQEPHYIVDHWGYLLEDIKSVQFGKAELAYDYVATLIEEYMKPPEL